MKHLFSLLSLVLFVGISQLTAQENVPPVAETNAAKKSCAKTCSKACAAKAAKAASLDEAIEKQVCEKSGKVTYQRKDVCQETGKISYTAVQYDEAKAQFVDIDESAVQASTMKKDCGKKKGCCAKKAKAAASSSENMSPVKSVGTEGTN